jgi:signal transduction histidine kinase
LRGFVWAETIDRMRRVAWLAAWVAGAALGVAAAVIAHRNPDYAFADTGALIAVELLVGYAVIASGLESWRRRPGSSFAALLAAGGCGWFLLELNNPGVASPIVFTIGLVLYAAAPPLIAHALLAYPAGPLGHLERTVVAAAYGGSLLLLGLVAALVFDPAAQGCSECPRNLLLVHGNASLYEDFNRAGIYLGLGWTIATVALLGWRLLSSTASLRGLIAPVLGAGCVYLGLVAAEFVASLGRGYLSNDPLDRRLWLATAIALILLTMAVGWSWLRARRTRTRLARLVVELAETPSPGRLESALARSLGDPQLQLSYPIADGRYVNADGQPQQPGATSTALVRAGLEVALLTHKPGLLDDNTLVEELAAVARLGLENERLHAELLAQLADLRASRARIVTTADAERRRLERDLHDGAQQRLVALTLELRLARLRLEAELDGDPTLVKRVQQAEGQLCGALAALRKLAAGIFPAVLADEGLAAAFEALAEDSEERLRIVRVPEGRLAPAVEGAVYRLVSETLNHADGHRVSLTAFTDDGLLVVEVESERVPSDLTDLEDRLGALDGAVELAYAGDGHARIRAEIPCAS